MGVVLVTRPGAFAELPLRWNATQSTPNVYIYAVAIVVVKRQVGKLDACSTTCTERIILLMVLLLLLDVDVFDVGAMLTRAPVAAMARVWWIGWTRVSDKSELVSNVSF